MSIYGQFLNEGFLLKNKRLEKAKKYIKFANEFLNKEYDLGYNSGEILGTLLALKFMNISESKIIDTILDLSADKSNKYYNPIYIRDRIDFESVFYINYDDNFDIVKNKNIIIIDNDFFLYLVKETKKIYTINNHNLKSCSIYNNIDKAIEKIYFNKKEFDKVYNKEI